MTDIETYAQIKMIVQLVLHPCTPWYQPGVSKLCANICTVHTVSTILCPTHVTCSVESWRNEHQDQHEDYNDDYGQQYAFPVPSCSLMLVCLDYLLASLFCSELICGHVGIYVIDLQSLVMDQDSHILHTSHWHSCATDAK